MTRDDGQGPSNRQLHVATEVKDGVAWVSVLGDIDMSSVDGFRTMALDLCDDGAEHIVIDAAGITFVDSSGLAVLVTVAKACRVSVVGPTDQFRKLLAVTGVDALIEILSTNVPPELRDRRPTSDAFDLG